MFNHRRRIFSAVTYFLVPLAFVFCGTPYANAAASLSIRTSPAARAAIRPGSFLIAQNTGAAAGQTGDCPGMQREVAVFLAPLAGSLLNAAAGAGATFLMNYVYKKLKIPPEQQGALGSTILRQQQQPGTPDPGTLAQETPAPGFPPQDTPTPGFPPQETPASDAPIQETPVADSPPQETPLMSAECNKSLRVDYSAQGLPAGIAYEVYQLGAEGMEEPVDPNAKVFKTGDKIFLLFTANLPGMIDAFNIDSQGVVQKIAEWKVAGGEQVRLPQSGAIEFYKTTGNEKLSLYFYPCSFEGAEAMRVTQNTQPGQSGSPAGGGDQAGASIQADPNAVALLTKCTAVKKKAYEKKTEAMRVVADAGTNFGVSNLDAQNLKQSTGEPLVIEIGFQHEP